MSVHLSKNVKKEVDKIHIPKEKLNRAIEKGLKKGKKDRRGFGVKILYTCSAAILFISLLIGSVFVSPAMARVVSNIPYLSEIFQSKDIVMIITEELEEKGYHTASTGIGYNDKKTVEISLQGSDEYYNEVKDEVAHVVNQILKSRGYDAYSVNVNKSYSGDYVLNDEEEQEKSLLTESVTDKLNHSDYKFDMVQVDPTENVMFINIVGSDKYYESIQDTVKEEAKNVAETNHYNGYEIKVTRMTTEIKPADKESELIATITEGLMSKKEFRVTGVGNSVEKIFINTSIQSSDPSAKELGLNIEAKINEFLTSEDALSILGDNSYEIIIYSKDEEVIN
ncbi:MULTISPECIES: DUF4030 domain-containing protein [Cytobacillus]|uniref:DUF4030 domain-containing protein n=1 Tax=Cytobacillus kochii TaxID=859143 RepID=A0A248TPX1_9BACI|nr:DUF4030 domain-containing protein [Cytobacillus kochii]ASV70246.1 hypothetical protein CKF48_23500 [Cytobacillus kochii]MDQ0186727.1 hypothetical protein [Cytobacillus kochii]